jgi:hypothetical protein
VQVTIFERDNRLGGRIHGVRKYDTGYHTVETGGDTFDTDDSLTAELARDVGVRVNNIESDYAKAITKPFPRISIWNGTEFTGSEIQPMLPTWNNLVRLMWQSGRSSRFWWRMPAQLYTAIKHKRYCEDWIEVLSRAAFAAADSPNKDNIDRFAVSWGLPRKPQKETTGSNERLLKRLVRMSGVSMNLQSTVTRITRHEDLTYDVHWSFKNGDGQEETSVKRFDAIIIAAPFHQANITFDPPLQSVPEKVDYSPLHVTHFISTHRLDPTTFNLPQNETVPDTIWNIHSQSNEESKSFVPAFLTLTRTDSSYLDCCVGHYENLYRVISQEPFSDNDIAILFNKTGLARKTVTFPDQSCYTLTRDHIPALREEFRGKKINWEDEAFRDEECYMRNLGCVLYPTVRWVHRQFWPNAVPVVNHTKPPGILEEKTQLLAPRLFYVSGFEGWTGASISRSVDYGQRAARKLYYDYISYAQPSFSQG